MKNWRLKLLACASLLAVSATANAAVVNPGFENSTTLSGWTSTGQAGVQTGYVYDGLRSAWIGTVDTNYDGNNDFTTDAATAGATNNSISQTIDASDLDSITINYQIWSGDYRKWPSPWGDEFGIQVDGTTVFSELGATAYDDGNEIYWWYQHSDWRSFSIDLTSVTSTFDLTIYTGNTWDNWGQTWAFVDLEEYYSEPKGTQGNADPVPEPATLLLFGPALLGVGAMRRRKAAKKA